MELETAKGDTPKVINIMDALKKSMQARGQVKVKDSVRKRMGKAAPKPAATSRASRSRSATRERAHQSNQPPANHVSALPTFGSGAASFRKAIFQRKRTICVTKTTAAKATKNNIIAPAWVVGDTSETTPTAQSSANACSNIIRSIPSIAHLTKGHHAIRRCYPSGLPNCVSWSLGDPPSIVA